MRQQLLASATMSPKVIAVSLAYSINARPELIVPENLASEPVIPFSSGIGKQSSAQLRRAGASIP